MTDKILVVMVFDFSAYNYDHACKFLEAQKKMIDMMKRNKYPGHELELMKSEVVVKSDIDDKPLVVL